MLRGSVMKMPELWYTVVVKDHYGKVISREQRRAHSFLKQWNQFIWFFHCLGSTSPRITNGSATRLDSHDNNFRMNGGEGDASLGIVVGTDNTPVTIEDYAMGVQIAEGFGAGQMHHLANTFDAPVVSPPSCGFSVSRIIVNNSGGLITVRESGIYHQHSYRYGPLADNFYFYSSCGVRDVFAAPQDVSDGGSITINYTLQVTE
jgi:hypothetical protein